MKRRKLFGSLLIFISVSLVCLFYITRNKTDNFLPCKNHNKKWRIGYYEGGPWIDYQGNLKGIVHGLMKLEWIERKELPSLPDERDTSRLWRWLSETAQSNYIEFISDAYWSSGWKKELREKNRVAAVNRLAERKDIDLMIVAGTWAGQDLANDLHKIPTIIISASDPVKAGIIKSAEDSGFDHVFAKVDPKRYIRQLRLFHTLTQFSRLGIIYEDTPEGRSYAALDDAYKVAKEKNFEIITCKTQFAQLSIEEAVEGTLKCIESLAQKIDAFYITDHRGQTLSHIDNILKPLLHHKIPTWAQSGSEFVKRGALYSTTKVEYDAYGLFYAKVIASFFNGKKLKDINQIFEDPKGLTVNTATARIIGYKVPPSILNNATVYTTISEIEGAK